MQTYVQPRLTEQQGHDLWRSMFADVNDQQLMTPLLARTLLKLMVLFLLLGVTLALSWTSDSFGITSAAYIGLALLLAQFAFVGHDAGHGAVSRHRAIDRALGQISLTLVTGLAFDEWIERHRAHHRFCQYEERDPDMAVDYVVSLTEKSKRRKGAVGQFLTRYQVIHIWLLALLFGHSQRHLSQAAVLGNLRRYSLDALMLVVHLGIWFGIPCLLLDVPFHVALLAYVVPLTILGPYLAAIFWVNHVGMPLIEETEKFSFFEHQYVTSRTILNPPTWDWLFGGLNFQIEHHLFPQVPSNRLGAVQTIVQKHFTHNGITYHGVSWFSAIRSIATHLHQVARAP